MAQTTASVTLADGSSVTVEDKGRDGEGRTRYAYTIVTADGYMHTGDDMSSGVQGGTAQEGLESLASFVSAFAEAQDYPDSENRDLFPAGLAEWAQANADDLALEVAPL